MKPLKTILTIAGSDPSGGAGIQADLKTFTVLGRYGAAVPTNLTVQNTQGVKASHPIAPEIVRDQIDCVLTDLDVTHIKIGMIGTIEIAQAICSSLEDFRGEIILDPVLRASDGNSLTDNLKPVEILAQHATVLTPNFDELCRLTQSTPDSTKESLEACETIFASFSSLRCIVLKGGHFPDQTKTVTDHLFIRHNGEQKDEYTHSHPKITTQNTHGTGCTYASAFAAYHQKSADYCQAFTNSSNFVYQLLKLSAQFKTGKGRGGLLHHLFLEGKNETECSR